MIIQNKIKNENFFKFFIFENQKENQKENIKRTEDEIKKLEEEFDKTINRENWYVVGMRTRRIWTPDGDIKITRRIYKNRHTSKSAILFDKEIGLEKYNYVLNCFLDYILMNIPKIYSYKKLTEVFGLAFSSIQISRMLERYDMYLKIKKLGDFRTVYVNLDGIFVNQWKKKRYEIKFATCFTGVIKGKRNKLKNRIILPFKGNLTAQNIAFKLERFIKAIYGDVKEVIIVGDGAGWISQVPKYFSIMTASRYIDKFHFLKWIKDLAGRNTKIDWKIVQSGSKDKLREYLLKLITNEYGEVKKYNSNIKIINKIIKFRTSYLDCKEKGYINVIEAMQSHYAAPILKYKRSFSKRNGYKVLMLNIAKVNNWTINQDKNNSLQLEKYYSKDATIDLSILSNDQVSNAPILYSENSETVKIFNSLIHGN